jgi:hypothetical protein
MGIDPNELVTSTIGPTVDSDVEDTDVSSEGPLEPLRVHRENGVDVLSDQTSRRQNLLERREGTREHVLELNICKPFKRSVSSKRLPF